MTTLQEQVERVNELGTEMASAVVLMTESLKRLMKVKEALEKLNEKPDS